MCRFLSLMLGSVMLVLAGCSTSMPQLNVDAVDEQAKKVGLESGFDVAVLALGTVAGIAGKPDAGAAHYAITKGAGRIVEDWADYQFTHPKQEWIADGVAILGTGLAAAYWIKREGNLSGASFDKKGDAYFPLIPLGQMIWKRLRFVQ